MSGPLQKEDPNPKKRPPKSVIFSEVSTNIGTSVGTLINGLLEENSVLTQKAAHRLSDATQLFCISKIHEAAANKLLKGYYAENLGNIRENIYTQMDRILNSSTGFQAMTPLEGASVGNRMIRIMGRIDSDKSEYLRHLIEVQNMAKESETIQDDDKIPEGDVNEMVASMDNNYSWTKKQQMHITDAKDEAAKKKRKELLDLMQDGASTITGEMKREIKAAGKEAKLRKKKMIVQKIIKKEATATIDVEKEMRMRVSRGMEREWVINVQETKEDHAEDHKAGEGKAAGGGVSASMPSDSENGGPPKKRQKGSASVKAEESGDEDENSD